MFNLASLMLKDEMSLYRTESLSFFITNLALLLCWHKLTTLSEFWFKEKKPQKLRLK